MQICAYSLMKVSTDLAAVILLFYRLGLDGMKMQVNFVFSLGQQSSFYQSCSICFEALEN